MRSYNLSVNSRDRVAAYFAAVNAEDWEAVFATFHPDAVIEVPRQAPKRGLEAIGRFYRSVPRQFPEHHDDPIVVVGEGDDVMAAIEFTGVAADGSGAHFWAADHFHFQGDKVTHLRILFDPLPLAGS